MVLKCTSRPRIKILTIYHTINQILTIFIYKWGEKQHNFIGEDQHNYSDLIIENANKTENQSNQNQKKTKTTGNASRPDSLQLSLAD